MSTKSKTIMEAWRYMHLAHVCQCIWGWPCWAYIRDSSYKSLARTIRGCLPSTFNQYTRGNHSKACKWYPTWKDNGRYKYIIAIKYYYSQNFRWIKISPNPATFASHFTKVSHNLFTTIHRIKFSQNESMLCGEIFSRGENFWLCGIQYSYTNCTCNHRY